MTTVRHAAVAGAFYLADPDSLSSAVTRMLAEAQVPPGDSFF